MGFTKNEKRRIDILLDGWNKFKTAEQRAMITSLLDDVVKKRVLKHN